MLSAFCPPTIFEARKNSNRSTKFSRRALAFKVGPPSSRTETIFRRASSGHQRFQVHPSPSIVGDDQYFQFGFRQSLYLGRRSSMGSGDQRRSIAPLCGPIGRKKEFVSRLSTMTRRGCAGPLYLRDPDGQQRIIFQDRADPYHHRVHVLAQAVDIIPGNFAGDPARIT